MQRDLLLDRCQFPMLPFGQAGLYIHALPVTKIQLEHFLADSRDGHFNQGWYETVRRLNPRRTTGRLWLDNYWEAFATGILPSEAERFASWCGAEYRLPTCGEWSMAYAELAARGSDALFSEDDLARLGERARELVPRVGNFMVQAANSVKAKPGLETRCGFRYGVLEWIVLEMEAPGRWGAMGEPNPAFCGNLLQPQLKELVLPEAAETERDRAFGFRLVCDPKLAVGV